MTWLTLKYPKFHDKLASIIYFNLFVYFKKEVKYFLLIFENFVNILSEQRNYSKTQLGSFVIQ